MALLWLFLILSLHTLCHKVDARSHSKLERVQRFSRSQELESILVFRENEFDCVDIYKQPGFQHPRLKNHKIQLKPTFRRATKQSRSRYIEKAFKGDNVTKGCPPGKVPIYKYKSQKTKHQMSSNSMESQIGKFPQYTQQFPGAHYATLDTSQNTTYHGAYANINICALSILKHQQSLAQIYAQSGPQAELNTVKVGWGVFPDLYGDSQTRITGYFEVDEDPKTGCFNNICGGFLQVDPTYAFGIPLQTSEVGSDNKYDLNFQLEQDEKTGNWWFTFHKYIDMGYWPKEVFTHLANGASVIRFGGETGSLPSMPSPPMGTGYLPEAKFLYSCFFADLRVLDSQFKEQEVKPEDMKIYRDTDPKCYDLVYPGYSGPDYRQAFLFGGPGGQCGP